MPNSEGLTSIKDPKQRYTKAQCIGRGASKVVYKAFDEVEGIEVAWNEVLCSDACLGSGKERSRMLGEITMLRQLKHKNIMRLYDWWYDKQQQVLVFITELLTDGSLRRYIRRKHVQGVTLSVLKRYAWQILQGLVYLHGHYPPIIHRDLKCDNIFVNGASGELKIGDLGFATLLRGMSAPLSVIGTPEFMAPELYDEHYDEKVDIYSYGMCLLELATLEYPYSECTNPAQIYRKVTQGIPPASLNKVSDALLKQFILLTVNSDPQKRPEARQLLVHPFFEDLRQQIKMKGWLKGPAPALAAAAAAADPVRHATVAAVSLSPSGTPGAVRVPMSAPDGLAAIAAAVEAADAAAKEDGSSLLPPAAAVAGGSQSSQLQQQQRDQLLQQLQLNSHQLVACVAHQRSPTTAVAAELQESDRTNGFMAAAKQPCDASAFLRCADTRQQQDQAQQPINSSAGKIEPAESQQDQQQQLSSGRRTPTMRAAARSQSSPVYQSGPASPFASWTSCSSIEGFVGAQPTNRGSGSGRDTGGGGASMGAAGHHTGRLPRGRRHSLDELSEDDVVFDADSQVHTDDVESEIDEAAAAGAVSPSLSGVRQHVNTTSHQQHSISCGLGAGGEVVHHHYLDTIHEDADVDAIDGDDEGVDCVCRRIDHQQLSFNVGFFNKGMRKRVGFQYNADEDTVDDIAVEMLENLSLMPQEAVAIARKIRAALEALGISQGPEQGSNASCGIGAVVGAPATGTPPAAAASADSSGTPVTGKNAAIAIVATAAASAAIESCSTPQQGSIDTAGSYLSNGLAAGGSGRSSMSGSYAAANTLVEGSSGQLQLDAASTPGLSSESVGRTAASASQLAAAAAAAAANPSPIALNLPDASQLICSSSVAGHACTDQLVRELSMLNREQGQALLQTLQEDLLIQSIAMPEVAAAVGVELGMPLSSPQSRPGEGLLEGKEP